MAKSKVTDVLTPVKTTNTPKVSDLGVIGTAAKVTALMQPQQTPLEAAGKYTISSGLKDAYAALTAAQNAYSNPTKDTTYSDMAAAYEARARESLAQQEAALLSQLQSSKQSTNAGYDSAASQNYINYMRQRGALPEQLATLGINGGASETALARIGNNYALNQGSTSASRNAALSQLQGSYDTNVAKLRQTIEDNIAANNLQMQQAQAQFDYQRQQDAYNRLQDAYARAASLEQQQYERKQAATENKSNYYDKWALKYAESKKGLKSINDYIKKYKKNNKSDKYYKEKLAALYARRDTIQDVLRAQK